MSPTSSAPSTRWRTSCVRPTPRARRSSWTARRRRRLSRSPRPRRAGAAAAPHLRLALAGRGCDFYVFSGHKMLGPTGIGVLYGRREVLETTEPALGGSGAIKEGWVRHG